METAQSSNIPADKAAKQASVPTLFAYLASTDLPEAAHEQKEGESPPREAPIVHPLDGLLSREILEAATLVKKEAQEPLRFESIELKEPPKAVVRAFQPGDAIPREATVSVYKLNQIGVSICTVSLTEQKVLDVQHHEGACPMIQLEEFMEIEEACQKDARFVAACKGRGIQDMSLVCVDPWSAGAYQSADEVGKHICHAFCWLKTSPYDNLYAHPIEGLHPVIDIKACTVIRVDDHGSGVPIPMTNCNYEAQFLNDFRHDLKPIDVVQPEGVSFSLRGKTLKWIDWSILIGFSAREGLTLHNVSFAGRPVLYRASIAEMVVPYGSPEGSHFRKNVFDIGEYGIGKLANQLELGCDCLGSIHYMDAWISDINGNPFCLKNAVCIHEEDSGVLWKHWDFRTERTEVRRGRRLVLSFIATVGNYEYGSYWYFYLDGTIEFEMKATGIINTVACEPFKGSKYGCEVMPGVFGQIHQHHFCARLDLSIDGDKNIIKECDTIQEPYDPKTNPHGNAFYVKETPITTEGGRERNPDTERYWKFASSEKTNHVGKPTAFKLEPMSSIRPFVHPDSPSGKRMPFIYKQLWVTPYDPSERFPAGHFMHHSDGSDGLGTWTKKGRATADTDVVAWHVFGLHHPVRPEDFPVQPVVSTGFKLMANGFFDRNPCLNLPPGANAASDHAWPVQGACCH